MLDEAQVRAVYISAVREMIDAELRVRPWLADVELVWREDGLDICGRPVDIDIALDFADAVMSTLEPDPKLREYGQVVTSIASGPPRRLVLHITPSASSLSRLETSVLEVLGEHFVV